MKKNYFVKFIFSILACLPTAIITLISCYTNIAYALSIVLIILGAIFIFKFKEFETYGFDSLGEYIDILEIIKCDNFKYFIIYLMPLIISNSNSLIFKIVIILMAFGVIWTTDLWYNNPILSLLRYKTFIFQFTCSQNGKDKKYIGITQGMINTKRSIKKKPIVENVFLIYNDF